MSRKLSKEIMHALHILTNFRSCQSEILRMTQNSENKVI